MSRIRELVARNTVEILTFAKQNPGELLMASFLNDKLELMELFEESAKRYGVNNVEGHEEVMSSFRREMQLAMVRNPKGTVVVACIHAVATGEYDEDNDEELYSVEMGVVSCSSVDSALRDATIISQINSNFIGEA